MRRLSAVAVFVLSLVLVTGCGSTLVRVNERFSLDVPWEDYERVVIRTGNGHVELFSEEREGAAIGGVKQAGGLTWMEAEENLGRVAIIAQPDETDASTLMVRLEYPEALRHKSMGADFEIRVPAPCAADIATANGYIRVRGLRDRAVLHTGNGRIIAEDVTGDIQAESSNGRIVVRRVDGMCELKTSNGRIEAHDVNGSVRATTSNGSIFVRATPPPEGRAIMQSSNGSIKAVLPPNLHGTLSLRCDNGRVSADLFGIALSNTHWSKQAVEAQLNGGGSGEIRAHTSNGSITIECQ